MGVGEQGLTRHKHSYSVTQMEALKNLPNTIHTRYICKNINLTVTIVYYTNLYMNLTAYTQGIILLIIYTEYLPLTKLVYLQIYNYVTSHSQSLKQNKKQPDIKIKT